MVKKPLCFKPTALPMDLHLAWPSPICNCTVIFKIQMRSGKQLGFQSVSIRGVAWLMWSFPIHFVFMKALHHASSTPKGLTIDYVFEQAWIDVKLLFVIQYQESTTRAHENYRFYSPSLYKTYHFYSDQYIDIGTDSFIMTSAVCRRIQITWRRA